MNTFSITLVLLIPSLLLPVLGFSQTVVSIAPGYTHQAFYSLENGTIATVPNDNWDLAFQIRGFAAAIRINSTHGVHAYKVPDADISAWASVDTVGIDSWTEVYDSDESWDAGALNQGMDSGNDFDLGWGVYDFVTHHVNGDSLFVIQLPDGSFRKLKIDKLAGGIYTFMHAKLDGTDEVAASLNKGDFANKNFGYYSFATQSTLDREPASESYDLIFTQYLTELAPGLHYGVSGVLANGMDSVWIAEAREVDVLTVTDANLLYESNISTIGYDWKAWSGTAYDIEDSLAYFVKAVNDKIYKVVFTDFGGSATGTFEFNQSTLTTHLEPTLEAGHLLVYPNPATDALTIDLPLNSGESGLLVLTDLTGKVIRQEELAPYPEHQTIQWDHLNLPAGIYLLNLTNTSRHAVHKIQIR